MLEMVPLDVPFSTMLAPIMGSPFSSVTTPPILIFFSEELFWLFSGLFLLTEIVLFSRLKWRFVCAVIVDKIEFTGALIKDKLTLIFELTTVSP